MTEIEHPIRPHKAELAHFAVRKHDARSVADIGACWGVHGGYIIDLLSKQDIDQAFIADQFITRLSRERGSQFSQLKFIEGIFNDKTYISSFPNVDALIMFDILLHQVDLDWDEFLSQWSKKTRIFIIYNQNWMKDDHTVRFVDKGREWYKENVIYSNEENVDAWFDDLDGIDHRTGRKKRDLHMFWQWGITRNDMISHVEALGFRLDYLHDYGPFALHLPWIRNQGLVFVR